MHCAARRCVAGAPLAGQLQCILDRLKPPNRLHLSTNASTKYASVRIVQQLASGARTELWSGALEPSSLTHHPPPTTSLSPRSLARHLRALLLPADYPRSVAPRYAQYALLQACHHCMGSANAVLSSSFLLYALGLGAGTLPTAGALAWVLKDGLGQLGTLLFARCAGHSFDIHARGWYVGASALLDAAALLEVGLLAAPSLFVPGAALANALKGLAWMGGGAARTSFNVTFARDANIADVTAKAASQTICSSLLGTGVGMALAHHIQQDLPSALAACAVLGTAHLATALQSAKSVPISTLNPPRLELLLDSFLVRPGAALPRPQDLAALEPLLPRQPAFRVGADLRQLSVDSLLWLGGVASNARHILVPGAGRNNAHTVVAHEEAGPEDLVLGCLHAALFRRASRGGKGEGLRDDGGGKGQEEVRMLASALAEAQSLLPVLLDGLQMAGWSLQQTQLETRKLRCRWSDSSARCQPAAAQTLTRS